MTLNMHALVRGPIRTVNPDVTASWQRSTGYTTAANGQQQPSYATAAPLVVNEQAVSERMLAHLDSLNIAGTLRAFWCNGDVRGTDRTTNQGGDLLTVLSGTYLVVHVLETWNVGGWCHVIGQRQKV